MNIWRERLYGYTGLFVLFGIWTPVMWFASSLSEYYKARTFEVLNIGSWFNTLLFLALCVATLIAQFGFVLIAKEHSELENMKRQQSAP